MRSASTGLTALLLAACVAPDAPLAGEGQPYDVASYALRGEFDWQRRTLLATLDITLALDADAPELLVLDSAVDVTAVADADGRALDFSVDDELEQLRIDITPLAGRDLDALRLTVTYEAPAAESLRAYDVRRGDPHATRSVYTYSEPLDVPKWMPCDNRPDDRARFSVEMTMPRAETMIANGTRTRDAVEGETRTVAWATDYTLPPYLMAFAMGPFDTTEGTHDDLPIGTWRRPGLSGDHDLVVAELDRMIDLYEALIGPYPFEKYQLVLLPGVGGGIEHASITFQGDTVSSQPTLAGDLQLTAHELVHQWWGDLVTVHEWDDVWIKEGLATMLSTEALRAAEDRSDAGTLMGDWQYASAEAPIRDPDLPPEEKYTSGPYGRAAWLFTQIRGVVGDEKFFTTLRALLDDRAFGTIATDDMVAAFAPHLGDAAAARVRNAIDAVALPTLKIRPIAGGAELTLSDPGDTLVAPFDLEWRRAGGDVERVTLVPGKPLALTREAEGDLLVLDPRDIHLRPAYFIADDDSRDSYYADLMPLLLPGGPDLVAAFSALPGVHQRFALLYAGLPPIAPEQLPGLLDGLHSDGARSVALRAACIALTDVEEGEEPDPALLAAWSEQLTAAFTGPVPLPGVHTVASYSECATVVDAAAMFADEYAQLAAGLETRTIPEPRQLFLARFDLDPDEARDIWGPVVRRGHSLRARGIAASKLAGVIDRLEDDVPRGPFREFVLDQLAAHETSEVLGPMLSAAADLASPDPADNADLLAAIDAILHNPVPWQVHGRALCSVIPLVGDNAGWDAFVAGLDDAPLSSGALDILEMPEQCL